MYHQSKSISCLFFFFACLVNQRTITTDLNDLHTTIQDIRSACQKMPATSEDRFAVVMSVSFQELLMTSSHDGGVCVWGGGVSSCVISKRLCSLTEVCTELPGKQSPGDSVAGVAAAASAGGVQQSGLLLRRRRQSSQHRSLLQHLF